MPRLAGFSVGAIFGGNAMAERDQRAEQSWRGGIEAEIADSFDEELEMELDDGRLARLLEGDGEAERATAERHLYFRELFRLQAELVKLQDWVVYHKRKIVVIFEGRDAAGKGGVIKRITQRLNPRVCRAAAL